MTVESTGGNRLVRALEAMEPAPPVSRFLYRRAVLANKKRKSSGIFRSLPSLRADLLLKKTAQQSPFEANDTGADVFTRERSPRNRSLTLVLPLEESESRNETETAFIGLA